MMNRLPVLVGAIWFVAFAPTQAFGSDGDFLWPSVIAGSTAVTGTFAVGNFVYIGKGYKPPAIWRIGGYVMGALDVAGGLSVIILSGIVQNISDTHRGDDIGYLTGGVMMVVGGVTILSAILSGNLPTRKELEKEKVQVGLSPILLRDSNNALAGGVGLSVVGW